MRAIRNAALGAHYVIEEENLDTRFVKVFKSNHVDGQDDRYAGLTVELNVSFASSDSSLVCSVAVERQYEVTKNRELTQAGIGPVAVIPLPTGETQAVTVVRRDTIDDEVFFSRLYGAIDGELDRAQSVLAYEGMNVGRPMVLGAMARPSRPVIPEEPVSVKLSETPEVIPIESRAPAELARDAAPAPAVVERPTSVVPPPTRSRRSSVVLSEPVSYQTAGQADADRPLRRGEVRREIYIPPPR
jgi:hypothetical protein